jgi:hypothetical protein
VLYIGILAADQRREVGSEVTALKYLAPYIFRVAISASGTCRNSRIVKLADDQVTFRYKDANTGKTRHCTVTAEEFIRRFLEQSPPWGSMCYPRALSRSAITASSVPLSAPCSPRSGACSNSMRLLNGPVSLEPNPWQKRRSIQPTRARRTAAPGAARSRAGLKYSRLSAPERPEHGLHDVRGSNLDCGGVQTHSVPGFVLPDFRKRRLWDTGSSPYAPQRPPAELECGGDWQISAASAKIVSGSWLETNRYLLACPASPEGRYT